MTKVRTTWSISRRKNEELKKSEEALPRQKECGLDKVRDCTKQRQEWCVTASTQSSPDIDKNKERGRGGVLGEGEQSGNWPQQACTTMFLLLPKNVTSESDCAHADVDTLVGSSESTRRGEVVAEGSC